jgi:hypothetical protein
MRQGYLTGVACALVPLWAGACSGEAKSDALFTPRDTGSNLSGQSDALDDGAGELASAERVGGFPGSGTSGSGAPLSTGFGPDTAGECASDVVPAAGASALPVETVCLYSDQEPDKLAATIEQVLEVVGEREWVHVRLTLSPSFVDNSYGATAIGWEGREKPGKGPAAGPDGAGPLPKPPKPEDRPAEPGPDDAPLPSDGATPLPDAGAPPPAGARAKPGADEPAKAAHTFRDLVGSDHAEIELFDDAGAVRLHFELDYISESAAAPSGYASLGVSGGEGKVIEGDPAWILAATTSLDRNLNGCGLGSYLEDSPETDAAYTPNPEASAWDYRVVYEVWVDPFAFGARGFGTASIQFVHASPSKFSNDTANVTPGPCPTPAQPPDDDGTVIFPTEDPPAIR